MKYIRVFLKRLEYMLFWDEFETRAFLQQVIKDELKTTEHIYVISYRFDYSHFGEGYGFVVVYSVGIKDNTVGKFVVKR